MSVSPARLVAFKILLRILDQDAYASELLHSRLTESLNGRDLRLATELVFGVLRHQSLLDYVLTRHSRTELGRLDPEVLLSLRLAAYQILRLDRVPPPAALHESVELVKLAKLRSAAGFVNAVLRKIKRPEAETSIEELPLDSVCGLATRFSHPEWLVQRWMNRFGIEKSVQLLKHNNRPPQVFFRINSPGLSRESIARQLAAEAVQFRVHGLSEDVFEVTAGEIYQAALFQRHEIAIQDAGSQIVPRLLDLKPSDTCLDLCAGTGGKASQIARLKASRSTVVAMDLHRHRLEVGRILHANQWKEIHWLVCDGTRPLPFTAQFDKILVDAPCSGSGTLQRHPEIRWRLKSENLESLPTLQRLLLSTAFQRLKPGGRLVYCTCSMEEEENESVVRSFLRSNSGASLVLPDSSEFHARFDTLRFLTLFPPETKTDGFFAVVIQKNLLT